MANTKMCAPDQKRVRRVRARGGHIKFRALRLDAGNFAWGSESATKKTRILQVVYNASNNELVRTNTLVKNAIIQVDATPFRQFYEQHYGVSLGGKKGGKKEEAASKKSDHVQRKLSAKSERVKAVDLHPREPWVLSALYDGSVGARGRVSSRSPNRSGAAAKSSSGTT